VLHTIGVHHDTTLPQNVTIRAKRRKKEMESQEMEMIVGTETELGDWRGVEYVTPRSTRGVSPALTIDERGSGIRCDRHTTSNRSCVPWIIEGELNHRWAQENNSHRVNQENKHRHALIPYHSVAFSKQPVCEIVQSLLFAFLPPDLLDVLCDTATLESLLADPQRRFDLASGKKASVHFLAGGQHTT
jgi:hypothetical protein